MQKVRKRRSFSTKVTFSPIETKETDCEERKEEKIKEKTEDNVNKKAEKKTDEKRARRIGNYVRYGKTVFELHEDKGDSIYCTLLEVLGLILAATLIYTSYYHYEAMHFHVAKGYGHLGYASAQHVVGQRLLTGRGAEKNETEAMRWFKYAADQGHPEASFNLAVGHIHGEKTGLRRGQATKLLHHAKKHGVDGADHALNLCARRGCDM